MLEKVENVSAHVMRVYVRFDFLPVFFAVGAKLKKGFERQLRGDVEYGEVRKTVFLSFLCGFIRQGGTIEATLRFFFKRMFFSW